jgi:WD40 repeat protein
MSNTSPGTAYLRALSPDEVHLAEILTGGQLHITHFPRGEMLRQIEEAEEAHVYDILALAWSPNGKYLATGGLDSQVKVWDFATGACLQIYRGHAMPILDLAWSPHGTLLASGGGDETVQVWKPLTGETISTYHAHRATVNKVAWDADGEVLASRDSAMKMLYWKATSARDIDVSGRRYRFETHPWTRSSFVGSRWLLCTDIDRYDLFMAPVGMTGVVQWMEAGFIDPMIALKMDRPLRPDNPPLQQVLDEDYDNSIEWSHDTDEEEGIPEAASVWKAFITECQRLW